jgi:hypothetical protein
MLSGPPLPLPNNILLHQLLAYALQPGTLGAWVRGSTQALHLYEVHNSATVRILVDADLGRLLGRCDRIVLRHGAEAVVLDAAVIIQWRALQVVTSSPHLPSPGQLNQILPGAQLESAGFRVPLSTQSPEYVLAACLRNGIRVMESKVIYRPPALPQLPETLSPPTVTAAFQ